MLQPLDLLTQTVAASCRAASGDHPRGGWLRRREPANQIIPGAKPLVERLFQLVGDGWLKMEPRRLWLGVPGVAVTYSPGDRPLSALASVFAPDRLVDATRYDLLLAGHEFQLQENRTLILPAAAPLPTLALPTDGLIRLEWSPAATVLQGRFTARLTGISIFRDHAVVNAEWRLLGFDLAKDPVVWWGE